MEKAIATPSVLTSFLALILIALLAACGSEEPDTFVFPEELCPSELEVDGIAGRVVNERGAATVPDSRITLIFEDRSRRTITQPATDSDVRDNDAIFRFRNVPDGTHTLRACISSFHALVDVEVVDGQSTFQCLRLIPGRCEGRDT